MTTNAAIAKVTELMYTSAWCEYDKASDLGFAHLGRVIYIKDPTESHSKIESWVLCELRQLSMDTNTITLICTGIDCESGDQEEYELDSADIVYLPSEAQWKRMREVFPS